MQGGILKPLMISMVLRRALISSFLLLSLLVGSASQAAATSPCLDELCFGVFLGPLSDAKIRYFERLIGRHVRAVLTYQKWGEDPSEQPPFPLSNLKNKVMMHDGYDTETLVQLVWLPWVSLNDIVAGRYDAYITQYAQGARRWGRPIWLRFGHEMIHDDDIATPGWYPWQDQPVAYVAAFRHVVDIFRRVGADNVMFVWGPNSWPADFATVKKYYPGRDVVDWIGIDGYNYGEDGKPGWPWWQWFDDIFIYLYRTLVAHRDFFGDKPIMIAEFASTERTANDPDGVTKAAWIKDAISRISSPDYRRIRAFFWFNIEKDRDWRIETSAQSLRAFQDAAAVYPLASHPWDGITGILRLRKRSRNGQPRYQLKDVNGQTVALLKEGPLRLAPYLGRSIKVAGSSTTRPGGAGPAVITPEFVEQTSEHQALIPRMIGK